MGAIKEDLHRLIDSINNENLLKDIFMILTEHEEQGSLWAKLSEERKKEVLDSEKEIENPSSWVSHEEIIKML